MAFFNNTPEIASIFPDRLRSAPLRKPTCGLSEFYWLKFLGTCIQTNEVPTLQTRMLPGNNPTVITYLTKKSLARTSLVLQSSSGKFDGVIFDASDMDFTPLRTLDADAQFSGATYAKLLNLLLDSGIKQVGHTGHPNILNCMTYLCIRLDLPLGEKFCTNILEYTKVMRRVAPALRLK